MIFLDYASATPVSKAARKAMEPYFSEQFFNPSAPYFSGMGVREDYENAKWDLAQIIGVKPGELIITSGATEANKLAFGAIDGALDYECDYISLIRKRAKAKGTSPFDEPRVGSLILETEHDSVIRNFEMEPFKFIKVKSDGLIDMEDFKSKLAESTIFVSVALANNELGTIQPIAEIAKLVKEERLSRLAKKNPLPIFFHTDASQALGLIPISVPRLGVDLMTLNSAKVYGPKGVGALYKSRRVRLEPITVGGGQEQGIRAGTENVPGLMGFVAAAKEAKARQDRDRKKYEKLVRILKEELDKAETKPIFLGNRKHQLANFCPVCFPGIDAERVVYHLEEDEEVCVATGAACAASEGRKSHVLRAIGLTDEEINGSLRITLGRGNTEENIRAAGRKIVRVIKEELQFSRQSVIIGDM